MTVPEDVREVLKTGQRTEETMQLFRHLQESMPARARQRRSSTRRTEQKEATRDTIASRSRATAAERIPDTMMSEALRSSSVISTRTSRSSRSQRKALRIFCLKELWQ